MALAPLPAIALGALSAAQYQVTWSAYLPNWVALGLGCALYSVMRRLPRTRVEAWLPIVVALAVAGTLLAQGIAGVQRWVSVGPLRLNVSAMMTPWLLASLASRDDGTRLRALLGSVALQLVHVAQPDAAQASALTAGALPLVLASGKRQRATWAPLGVLLVALCALAWQRPDPLEPVRYVEGSLRLIGELGAPWVVAAVLAMLALFAPLLALGSWPLRTALAGYLLVAFAVTWLGYFPVPVMGAGAAPVLGWYGLLWATEAELSRS